MEEHGGHRKCFCMKSRFDAETKIEYERLEGRAGFEYGRHDLYPRWNSSCYRSKEQLGIIFKSGFLTRRSVGMSVMDITGDENYYPSGEDKDIATLDRYGKHIGRYVEGKIIYDGEYHYDRDALKRQIAKSKYAKECYEYEGMEVPNNIEMER